LYTNWKCQGCSISSTTDGECGTKLCNYRGFITLMKLYNMLILYKIFLCKKFVQFCSSWYKLANKEIINKVRQLIMLNWTIRIQMEIPQRSYALP
jgi:lysophospholipid acyltransferase (LPLAT)-like uncharacterized protein